MPRPLTVLVLLLALLAAACGPQVEEPPLPTLAELENENLPSPPAPGQPPANPNVPTNMPPLPTNAAPPTTLGAPPAEINPPPLPTRPGMGIQQGSAVIVPPPGGLASDMFANFSGTISGDFEGEMASMLGVDICIFGAKDFTWTNSFLSAEDEAEAQVNFRVTPDLTPGEYTIMNAGLDPANMPDNVLLGEARITTPDGTVYDQETEAIITLETIPAQPDEDLTGSFEITLTTEDETSSITISGTFTHTITELCDAEQ